MQNCSFLLSQAQVVATSYKEEWVYADDQQLNLMEKENGLFVPVCNQASIVTSSKTEAAPGDDDPDPEMEFCY